MTAAAVGLGMVCGGCGDDASGAETDAIEACMGSPPAQEVPFLTVDGFGTTPVLHWDFQDGCIPVLVAPAADGRIPAVLEGALLQAADAWSSLPCSDFCFEVSSVDPPPLAPSVRVESDSTKTLTPADLHLTLPAGDLGFARLEFDAGSGRLTHGGVTVGLIDEFFEDFGEGGEGWESLPTAVLALGAAAGLRPIDRDVDATSVMSLSSSRPPWPSPTVPDEEAFCLLYGPEPYCDGGPGDSGELGALSVDVAVFPSFP